MACLLGGHRALAPGLGVDDAVDRDLREQVLRGGNVRDRALLHACLGKQHHSTGLSAVSSHARGWEAAQGTSLAGA